MAERLGQHFLHSSKALTDIVNAGEILPTDTIVEIGPGKGVLTRELLKKARKVIAVEKDSFLVTVLRTTFENEIATGKLILLEQDIRDFKPEECAELLSVTRDTSLSASYKVIANIPYYITGFIIRAFLESKLPPTLMVLLIQKEVAERIVAKDGKESIFSISVKVFGEPKLISKVPKGAFNPPPSVDSAVLAIGKIANNNFKDEIGRSHFFNVVRTGFASPRKTLTSNLKMKWGDEEVLNAITKSTLNPKIRAERLSLEDWKKISNYLKE